jgi:exopolyphosphatase/guanosine-5'-triphosphate,3'-diphosphate pyrophosphatase
VLAQLHQLGFLCQFESQLSTSGDEMGMLEDMAIGVESLSSMTEVERSRLPGVSAGRAPQLLAGAIVAEAVIDLLDVSELIVCPWALREGLILHRMDGLPE